MKKNIYNNVKICLAQIDDLNQIHNILIERCKWFVENNIEQWRLNKYPNKYNNEYFRAQMDKNYLYIAKENNRVIGVMLLKNTDKAYWNTNDDAYYIHHLATKVGYNGIGKLMINFAINKATSDKKDYLRLDCVKNNLKLNDYYSNIGFKKKGSNKKGTYEYNLWEMKIKEIILN